jgi:radical SAM superfamily enzyme
MLKSGISIKPEDAFKCPGKAGGCSKRAGCIYCHVVASYNKQQINNQKNSNKNNQFSFVPHYHDHLSNY